METALRAFVSGIETQLERGDYAVAVFMDVEGAFSLTSPQIICEEAASRGVPRPVVDWMMDVLGTRKIFGGGWELQPKMVVWLYKASLVAQDIESICLTAQELTRHGAQGAVGAMRTTSTSLEMLLCDGVLALKPQVYNIVIHIRSVQKQIESADFLGLRVKI